jgi:hypothetical protein
LRAKAALPQIIAEFGLSPERLAEKSPTPVHEHPIGHWRLILRLFQPNDIVWIGDIHDSGRFTHAKNFRCVSCWLTQLLAPGSFTCPSTFKPGTFARREVNSSSRPFLVVESDTLSKQETVAIFLWLNQILPLRAVVDTAGKSLHGWFEYPDPVLLQELRCVLPAIGCDPAVFRPTQPCRLPGAQRGSLYQRLIYLNLPANHEKRH